MSGFSSNYNNQNPNTDWNDLYIDKYGNLATVSGNDDVIETCYHAVLLTAGDWIFNTNIGIPWDTYLSSTTPIGNKVQQSVIQAIQGVTGVNKVTSFNAEIDKNRVLQITVGILLINGSNIVINVPVSG